MGTLIDRRRTAITVTLTTHNTVYNLFSLIVAADTTWEADEVAYLQMRVPGGSSAQIAECNRGAVDLTTNGGFLISPESTTEYSEMNDINLHDIWLITDTDGATLQVKARVNRHWNT